MSKKKRTYVEIEDLEDPIPAGGRIMKCPSCGAPVTSEICDECGVETDMHPVMGNMEYQHMDCTAVALHDTAVLLPALLAVICGVQDTEFLLGGLVCAAVSVAATVILVRNLARYIQVKRLGVSVPATVCGFTNGMKHRGSNRHTKILRLLAETPDGKKLMDYPLQKVKMPYEIGQHIDILIYKDLVLIPKNQKDHR